MGISRYAAWYPRFTPSIDKSIHQIPGVPRTSQITAFFTSAPIGSHCKTRKYVANRAKKMGRRNKKRNICTGRYAPEASLGIGKKGAMPDPARDEQAIGPCGFETYPDLETENTFPS